MLGRQPIGTSILLSVNRNNGNMIRKVEMWNWKLEIVSWCTWKELSKEKHGNSHIRIMDHTVWWLWPKLMSTAASIFLSLDRVKPCYPELPDIVWTGHTTCKERKNSRNDQNQENPTLDPSQDLDLRVWIVQLKCYDGVLVIFVVCYGCYLSFVIVELEGQFTLEGEL